MRSKKTMLMVLTVLFVFVTTLIPMSAVAAGERVDYFDFTPNADGTWNNAIDNGVTLGWTEGSAVATQQTNPYTGAAEMNLYFENGSAAGITLGATGLNADITNKTVWYEYDLYADELTTSITWQGVGYANMNMVLNTDGSIVVGHFQAGPLAPAGTFKFGKPNHVVLATDAKDVSAAGELKFYLWVNGEAFGPFTNSSVNNTITSATAFGFRHVRNANEMEVNISRLKMYTTEGSLADANYNPTAYLAGCDITSNSVKLLGDKILVTAGTKVADLAAAIGATPVASFWNGATKIDSAAYATTDAIGLKVLTSNGSAIKEYLVIEDTGIVDYVDVAGGATLTNSVNGEGFTMHARYSTSASTNPYNGAAETNVAISGGSAAWASLSTPVNNLVTANKTVWYEWDIRIGDVFQDVRLNGLGYYGNSILIAGNGSIKLAHQSAGDIAPAGTIVPKKHYRIVIAADYIENGSYPMFTLWINGEKIGKSGSSSWAISGGNSVGITSYANAARSLYFSGIKVFTTDYSVDTAISTGKYDPTAYGEAAEIKSSAVTVSGNDILVPVGTTLADLSADIDAGLTVTYLDSKGAVTNDMTAAAIGTTVITGKDGEIKEYTVKKAVPTEYDERVITNNLFDMDFNGGDMKNNASSLTWNRVAGGANDAVADDATKGKVRRIEVTDASWYVLRQGGATVNNLITSGNTLWYEMSLKFENYVPRTSLNLTSGVFEIDNGRLYLGAHNSSTGYGTPIDTGIDLVTDKWYNLVIAIDYSNPVQIEDRMCPDFYIWVNGELQHYTAEDYTFLWNTASNSPQYQGAQLDMYINKYTENATNPIIKMDDFKIYETTTPVRKADGSLYFDPTYDFAKFTVDGAKVIGDKIYTDSAVTAEDFEFTMGSLVSVDGNNVIVKGEEGVGFSYYTVAAPVGYAVESAFTRMNNMSDATIVNTTDEDKTCVVALATYGANGLVDFEIVADAIAIDAGSEAWVRLPALSTANATVARVFVWDSFDSMKPAFASYDVTLN